MCIRSVVAVLVALSAALSAPACSGTGRSSGAPPSSLALPQQDGTIDLPGVSAPVSIVRDRWGIPHIVAANATDLFFAQGFVQAQDRLFQMDLWRRAALGRLSEVLGANFIQRDAMTRRIQYRGDVDVEWRAYGDDTREIVTAFTRGVNAWIDESHNARPDEFRLAGWQPEHWAPEDLLNRTDAFSVSSGANEELFRARLSSAIGVDRVNAMLPFAGIAPAVPPGVDLSVLTHALGEAIQRAGAPPFFAGFAAPFSGGSNAWAVDGTRTTSGHPLLAVDPHRAFEAPALRYLVHLTSPGWNVAGATAPWLPGVAIGHNEYMAWGMAAGLVDVQDVYVERLNPANARQVLSDGRWVDMTITPDRLSVKGRAEPFEFERQYTKHGPVIGVDRQRGLAYVLRWSGSEPGAAAELAALALDRARSTDEFVAALRRWKMPAVDVVFAQKGGGVGQRLAALAPRRSGFSGLLPVDGWSSAREWNGWISFGGREGGVSASMAVAANGDGLRASRIGELLSRDQSVDVEYFDSMQRDVISREALTIVPLLQKVVTGDATTADARQRLSAWDGHMAVALMEARLFDAWRRRMVTELARRRAPAEFVDGLADRLALSTILSVPTRAWFDAPVVPARDTLLVDALRLAAGDVAKPASAAGWAAAHEVAFRHPLAISDAARQRFNIGPFSIDGAPHTLQAMSSGARVGPAFRAVFDVGDWDRSIIVNAPGQSGWPDSPHYGDMAELWRAGRTARLPFSQGAVRSATKHTLTLRPVQSR